MIPVVVSLLFVVSLDTLNKLKAMFPKLDFAGMDSIGQRSFILSKGVKADQIPTRDCILKVHDELNLDSVVVETVFRISGFASCYCILPLDLMTEKEKISVVKALLDEGWVVNENCGDHRYYDYYYMDLTQCEGEKNDAS